MMTINDQAWHTYTFSEAVLEVSDPTSCAGSSICTSVRTSTAIDNPVTSQQESPFFLWSLGPVPA